jgi:hypothetical protein
MDWQTTELNNSWRYAFLALVRKTATYTDPQAIGREDLLPIDLRQRAVVEQWMVRNLQAHCFFARIRCG